MVHQIDLSRMDLNLLVLFEAVIEERNVGRAARRLNLSSSAVSHGLSRLRRLLNDPLFLKTPRGVTPTERALNLAAPITSTLAELRAVLSLAEPFDPATSRRRLTIGAPDGVSAVILAPLLRAIPTTAPGIDIAMRQVLPATGERNAGRLWLPAFSDLDARAMDIAILPTDQIAPRFYSRPLFDEDFVIAARRHKRRAARLTLERYLELKHVVVSAEGDRYGIVDQLLAERGLARRVALTVPNFLFALAAVSDSDMVTGIPRRFAQLHADRFDLAISESPVGSPTFHLRAIATRAAMNDPAIAWLMQLLSADEQQATPSPSRT